MPRQSVVPGFRFDAKRKRAAFEVTLPGTGGRVRRRKSIKASTRDESVGWASFLRRVSRRFGSRAAVPGDRGSLRQAETYEAIEAAVAPTAGERISTR